MLYSMEQDTDASQLNNYKRSTEDLYNDIEKWIKRTDKTTFNNYRQVVAKFFPESDRISSSKDNYITFLKEIRLRVQYMALDDLGLDKKPIDDLVAENAERAFKRKKKRAPNENVFLPSSPLIHDMTRIFSSLESIPDGQHGCNLPLWKEHEGTKIIVHVKENRREAEFSFPDKDKLSVDALKLFYFLLMKVNEQAFDNDRRMINDHIAFTISEVVKTGLYTEEKNARRGIEKVAETITTLSLKGLEITYGKKEVHDFGTGVYFTYCRIEKYSNIVKFTLNKEMNWNALLQFFMIMPKWCFSLEDKAFLLALEIFTTARIQSKATFSIPFRKLQVAMDLPDSKGHDHPMERLVTPIFNAINEIVEKSQQHEPIRIETIYPENSTPRQILATGYITVTLSGDAKTYITTRSVKKKQAIEDKARATQLTIEETKKKTVQG